MSEVRFVLVRPHYPANIGAAARAIKTMGCRQLWLVAPRRFPDPEADRLATEAGDVLAEARVVESLDEAIRDCTLVIATSARPRSADWPELSLPDAARRLAAAAGPVALLFGPEPSGLTSEELYRAHYRTWIDTAADCSSLNLAQAVQVCAYELRRATPGPVAAPAGDPPATRGQLDHLYGEIRTAIIQLDFPRRDPDHLMRRFERIFNRAALSQREVKLLQGLFARVQQRSSEPPR